jgi:hypothetical protein
MTKVPEATGFSLSRRQLMWLTTLGSLGVGLGVKSSEADPTLDIHGLIDEISFNVESLQNESPKPVGFEYTLPIVLNASSNRTPADLELLAGRLYYETYGRLAYAASSGLPSGDFSPNNLRSVLSGPLPTKGFSREYFDNLLQDTKTRVATDSEFRWKIDDSINRAKNERRRCQCTESTPCWFCVALVVLLIIIAII